MAKAGRPKVGERITVRVPADVLAELDRRASQADVSRAEAIRTLLNQALEAPSEDGVDRAQIQRRLSMTPAERLRTLAQEVRRIQALRPRAV